MVGVVEEEVMEAEEEEVMGAEVMEEEEAVMPARILISMVQ